MAAHTSTEPRSAQQLLAGAPPVSVVAAEVVAAAAADAPRLVVLDDDPTGTQSVADVPIITDWREQDLRWALRQPAGGFYLLTNTRSLVPAQAAARNREVLTALASITRELTVPVALVSRSDSTLRGHFPLETDVLGEEFAARFGQLVDGVLLIPAYIDAGRITVDSGHWVRTPDGFIPAGESEFAADVAFGYAASDLRAFVEEKSDGRWPADTVARVTLEDLRTGGVEHVMRRLRDLRGGRPMVVDAACDEDLRILALAAMRAEQQGKTFLYRTGPSFVRNRLGQRAHPPLSDDALAAMIGAPVVDDRRTRARGGLVLAGSYVGLTTVQLQQLGELELLTELELDVPALLAADDPVSLVESLAARAAHALAEGDVVLRTSRTVVSVPSAQSSLTAHARVSDALVETVRGIIARVTPRWIVAKGGITSSDVATRGLGIRRAWARGTLLEGIVSLWQPAAGTTPPYIVFAGNVGDEGALRRVVQRLRIAAA
jgi:uncharacterized protein YgbK (DUF1537 family)